MHQTLFSVPVLTLLILGAFPVFSPSAAMAQMGKYRTPIPDECTAIAACTPPGHDRVLDGEQICVNPYNKKMVRHAFWKKDKLEGDFACWDNDGTPVLEAHFSNGRFDGEVRRYLLVGGYDRSVSAWSRQAYRHGKREGLFVVPLGEGRTSVSFFRNDRKQGFLLQVAADGSIERYSDCSVDGKPAPPQGCVDIAIPGYEEALSIALEKTQRDQYAADNQQVTEFFADGGIRRRYTFVDGKYEGAYEVFYANGQLKLLEHFRDGRRHGPAARYDTNGTLLRRINYRDGRIRDFAQFYRDGTLHQMWARDIADDALVHYRDYYENGALREEGTRYVTAEFAAGQVQEAGVAHGAVTAYRSDGTPLLFRHYEQGKKAGLWWRFADVVVIEEEYDEGRLKARRLRDRGTDAVLRELEFTPDGSVALDRSFPGYVPELEHHLYPP